MAIKKSHPAVIQFLIDKNKYKSYLEIGAARCLNFKKIQCEKKVGVEPKNIKELSSFGILQQTSDEFFAQNKEKFDIIFIDGLHIYEQVRKDIENSLNILNDNGIILCHDMMPKKVERASPERKVSYWNGDCYKAWLFLRHTRPDLFMGVLNFDCGIGVIKKGSQQTIDIEIPITYEWFDKNRDKMNIIDRKVLESI